MNHMKNTHLQSHILYDSISVTFSKWQSRKDGEHLSGRGGTGSDYRRELEASLCGQEQLCVIDCGSWACTCDTTAQNHVHMLRPCQFSESGVTPVMWAITPEGDLGKVCRVSLDCLCNFFCFYTYSKIKCLWQAIVLRILKVHYVVCKSKGPAGRAPVFSCSGGPAAAWDLKQRT